jgi:hypothetical protein
MLGDVDRLGRSNLVRGFVTLVHANSIERKQYCTLRNQ